MTPRMMQAGVAKGSNSLGLEGTDETLTSTSNLTIISFFSFAGL